MSLIVKNLSKFYQENQALNSLDFSLEKGEIVGLLGPNGAGKSTLIKCICGLLNPSEGEVLMDNQSSLNNNHWKNTLGYLPENNPLFSDMLTLEYLKFIADLHQCSLNVSLIEKLDLSEVLDKKIHTLSKGFKQRVGLAACFMHSPNKVILDEPTSGLDPNQIIEFRNLIKEESKDKIILLSTHLMQEVEALCTRVLLLNKGTLVADLPIEQFKGKYKNLDEAFYRLTEN
ncbi:MAG: multidrug ABC transporter ATP-binding protein [Flavobacteriaceae bacterium]|nr:MAG: multidrug ABC transporter ATP-binding protein [Flavobacteriaceae bacterium]